MPVSSLNKTLLIPVELLKYAQRANLLKPLFFFIYLKCHTTGKTNIQNTVFEQLKRAIDIVDKRTFNKHFQKLIQLNWIGFGRISGTVFIRGFERLRQMHGFKSRTSVTFDTKYFNCFKEFISSDIIGAVIKNQRFLHEVAIPRKLRLALRTKEGAKPSLSQLYGPKPKYYGFSLLCMAFLMGCSKTKAVGLKKGGIENGFIKSTHHYEEIKQITRPDYFIRPAIADINPKIADGMVFLNLPTGGTELVIQKKDEITCSLVFKKRKKMSKRLFK